MTMNLRTCLCGIGKSILKLRKNGCFFFNFYSSVQAKLSITAASLTESVPKNLDASILSDSQLLLLAQSTTLSSFPVHNTDLSHVATSIGCFVMDSVVKEKSDVMSILLWMRTLLQVEFLRQNFQEFDQFETYLFLN